MSNRMITVDANEAAAKIAFKLSEIIAIYPITPASAMGEFADAWASSNQPNLWGTVPTVVELQSEGGAAGTVHGALQNGALTTTFTASQGLLLMIPNLYKWAGELTPVVLHVAARSLATHALSIFGDHSDVMSARGTGCAMLCSSNVQEAMDFAAIAQAATLASRVPFIHFFDGFRTSHEIQKIHPVSDAQLRSLIKEEWIQRHREHGLTPDAPVIRGTAQNPDVFFQAREASNPFYDALPGHVKNAMLEFGKLTHRTYNLFDYYGASDAEYVIVLMGSGVDTARETVEILNQQGYKVGVIAVRLFRPFSVDDFVDVIPPTVKRIAVLDRTKEPGAIGEPLYQDVVTAVNEAFATGRIGHFPAMYGGRYGLSSKEFTPAMVKAVYDNLRQPKPLNHFTVGINDDVTGLSLPFDAAFSTEPEDVFRAVFFGLGADGTVSANKNSIKIIGEQTDNYAQGYFVYDSKKSGSITISHLRFGPRPIRSAYLVSDAHFVACHQFNFLTRYDMLKYARPNGVFLLNAPYGKDEVWDKLPKMVQDAIIRKNLKFYVIDAENVSAKSGMGRRINTVMQTAFFAVSGILPKEEAIGHIKKAIQKTYGKRGDLIVKQNFDAVDQTVANIFEVKPATVTALNGFRHYHAPANASDFIRNTTMRMIAGEGEELPVSAFEADGTFPSGTACLEKRAIANEIPIMDPDVCIQCGKCAFVCPHSVIRMKAFPKELLADAPANFHAMPAKGKDVPEGSAFAIQVSPDDCTGCTLCVEVCPAKNRSNASRKAVNMYPIEEVVAAERENWEFFLKLPELDRKEVKIDTVRGSQFLQPLFEFSGACSGCGETPYLKLLSQLFGDRMLVANATGCSSIYGGNLPTTPWTKNADGRGPAWANSLFEDNAEFGLGYRLAVDMKRNLAQQYLREMRTQIGEELAGTLLEMYPTDEAGISEHRKKVAELKAKLLSLGTPEAKRLLAIADFLVHKSLWIVGGDGWAYDIGYGGLDHVLASGRDINILVMDTEVYSNTGGQMSKATPIGAVAKFAAGGKATAKKDLAFQAIQYGNVYVARVAFGANDTQTLKVLLEAEAHPGPSLVIAYSHCIAHGYDLQRGLQQQKLAVDTAYWPLFRFNPALVDQGKNPLVLDSKPPKLPLSAYMENEGRFSMLKKIDPARAAELMEMAQEQVNKRWAQYEHMVKAYEPDPKPETV